MPQFPFARPIPPPWRLALAALLALASPLCAQAPRDELLRLVPGDVGFCVVIQNLRGHAGAVLDSPFFEQVRRSPFGKALSSSAEMRQLEKVERKLQAQVGMDWARLRDDLVGDAVVFAFRPGPADRPEAEQGLVLVRARNARLLDEFVQKLNKAQKETGELKELAEREHKGVKYYRRVEKKESNYYCLRGPVLLFSQQEEILRQAIALDISAPRNEEPLLARQMRELGLGECLLAVWLNPRCFDQAVSRGARPGDEGAKTFQSCWKALQGAGLGLHVERELTVKVALRARVEDLPPSARRYLAEASKPSALWKAFPDNALVAVAGRVDVSALFDFLGELMSKETRRSFHADLERGLGAVLGKSFVKEVVPALGPDWGFCMLAPGAEEKEVHPRTLLALRLGPGDGDPPVDQAVMGALNFWAVLAVLAHNKQNPDRPIRLKGGEADKVPVKYLEGEKAFPPGVRPTFAVKDGFLLLASSPEVVRAFSLRSEGAGAPGGAGTPLLRVSFKDWRAYLKDRREGLAASIAEREGLTREQGLARIDGVRDGLAFFDRLEVRQQTSPGQVTFSMVLQPAYALKKP